VVVRVQARPAGGASTAQCAAGAEEDGGIRGRDCTGQGGSGVGDPKIGDQSGGRIVFPQRRCRAAAAAHRVEAAVGSHAQVADVAVTDAAHGRGLGTQVGKVPAEQVRLGTGGVLQHAGVQVPARGIGCQRLNGVAVLQFGHAGDFAAGNVERHHADRVQVSRADVQRLANQQPAHEGELYDAGTEVQDFRRLWLGARHCGRRRRVASCEPEGRRQ
jgi:hypothetical protein